MLVTWASFSRAFSMAMVTRLAIATRRRTSWGVNTERRRRQTSSTPMISPRTVSGLGDGEQHLGAVAHREDLGRHLLQRRHLLTGAGHHLALLDRLEHEVDGEGQDADAAVEPGELPVEAGHEEPHLARPDREQERVAAVEPLGGVAGDAVEQAGRRAGA